MGGPPRATITERFEAAHADKALVAELCHRLGFEPSTVSRLAFVVSAGGYLEVEVARLADKPGDPNRRLLQPVPLI